MKDRVYGLLTKRRARGITLTTFHSSPLKFCAKKLTTLLLKKLIYDTNDALAIIREALKNYRSDKEGYDKKIIHSKISFLKNNGISAKEFPETAHFDPDPYDIVIEYCYNYYQQT